MFVIVVAMCINLGTSVSCTEVHQSSPVVLADCIKAIEQVQMHQPKRVITYCRGVQNANS